MSFTLLWMPLLPGVAGSLLRWLPGTPGVLLLALAIIRPPAGGGTGLLICRIATREEAPYLTTFVSNERRADVLVTLCKTSMHLP